jgi:predicted amidophosphoribosyltransferase
VHAAAPYADEVRAVLLAHKERGALALSAPLGAALAGAVRAGLHAEGLLEAGALARDVLLVPVPSARAAVRARGHDPARRIALAAAGELRRTGTQARVLSVLRQSRSVADQSGLGSRQRLENLAGALQVAGAAGRLLAGGRVVLVDDLMTTGASLAEAARAVRAVLDESAVYGGVAWEGRAQREASVTEVTGVGTVRSAAETEVDRTLTVPGEGCVNGAGHMMCAAVVAASPKCSA